MDTTFELDMIHACYLQRRNVERREICFSLTTIYIFGFLDMIELLGCRHCWHQSIRSFTDALLLTTVFISFVESSTE
jgi:hypothetical protein